MIKLVTFASDIRLNALLCCSAAVLLTACGGGMSDTGAGPQDKTAAYSFDSAKDPSAANANATPAGASGDATTPVGVGATPQNYSGNFELVGYGAHPLAADAGTVTASATAPASAASVADGSTPTRLLASAVAVSVTPEQQITQLYQTLLGRSPEAGGLQFWKQAMANGLSLDQVAASIKNSAEYISLHPVGNDNTSIPATTNNYYVAPNGSDSAAGTKAAPFKTISRAAAVATKASTTVWVAPGTYSGGIQTTASGTASGRIYFVSTTKWGAKIVPPTSSSNDNGWDNRGDYVSIVGFEVDGSQTGSGKKWLQGIYNGGSYDVIQGNHVHHIATNAGCTSAGGSAIGVDSYFHGVKGDVIGNTVHDIGPAGCTYIQGIYVSTSGTIKNNVVYRVAEAAIHLWHDANNVIITNNTVTSSGTGIIVGGGDYYFTSAGNNNTAVYNNIVYDNKYGISEQGKTGTANTYRNNLVYKNTYDWTLKNGLTHTGTVGSDPLLAGYSRTAATPNYHLSSSSPAIGRGTATNALATDIDGKPRNASTGYDIGAFQH